jgi:hypothetical protein
MKRKIINGLKKFHNSIFLGFTDAILPNIKDTIKEKQSDFLNDAPKLDIDWTRLTSALVSFTIIILAIFDFITADDIIKFLTAWSALFQ